MKYFFILSIFSIALCSSFLLHPFHVSNCEITYNNSSQKFQIAQKIFIDDLESALADWGYKDLKIGTTSQKKEAIQLIENYLKSKLLFEINSSKMEWHIIGHEISKDYMTIWVYGESSSIPLPNTLKLSNKILLDKFNDQKNITSIETPNGKNSYILFQNGDDTKVVKLK